MEQNSDQKMHNVFLKRFIWFKEKNKLFKVDKPIKKNKNHSKYGRAFITSIQCWFQRGPTLFEASQLQNAGERMMKEGNIIKALECFVSLVKIHEKYSEFSLDLMASYIQVGHTIIFSESLNSMSYARIALKCFNRALAIQKFYHYHQMLQQYPNKNEIKVLEIAMLNCYVAKAFLLIGNANAAYDQAKCALRFLKREEEMAMKGIKLSRKTLKNNSLEVLTMCYLTMADALANRMRSDIDIVEAKKYYYLAIDLQEQIDINSMHTMTAKRELACFLYDIGNLDGALLHNEAALHILKQKTRQKGGNSNENKRSLGILLNNIGSIHKRMGNLDRAKDYFKRSISGISSDKDQLNAAFVLGNMGRLYLEYVE